MKTFRFLALLTLVLTISIIGCKKDDEETETAMPIEDAAELIASSFSTSDIGLTGQIKSAAAYASQIKVEDLGLKSDHKILETIIKDTTFSVEGSKGGASWSYSMNYKVGISETSFKAFVRYSATGNYTGPRYNSVETSNAEFFIDLVDYINKLKTTTTITGSLQRTGTQAFTGKKQYTCESSLSIVLTSLVVNKQTGKIESGNATLTLSGKTSNAGTFNFAGELVYISDTQATLTLNGAKFNVDLETGTITAV